MTLVFASLGFAPETGKAGIDMAILFKKQLRAVLPFVDGISPMIVPDAESQKCEVRVAFERGDEGAEEWVREARGMAAELWGTMRVRRGVERK